jgi:DNA-binding NarL/FixJ family response regulator
MPTTYHIPLKSLQPIHMKIIELYLKCWKKKDIAAELGVSATTVSHTLRDPIAQKIINAMMKESLHKSFLTFSQQT